jgi:hypothetical protein
MRRFCLVFQAYYYTRISYVCRNKNTDLSQSILARNILNFIQGCTTKGNLILCVNVGAVHTHEGGEMTPYISQHSRSQVLSAESVTVLIQCNRGESSLGIRYTVVCLYFTPAHLN